MSALQITHSPDHGPFVLQFVQSRVPGFAGLEGKYVSFGIVRHYESAAGVQTPRLVGGVIATQYSPCEGGGDIHLWAAGDTGWCSRRVIKDVFTYVFRYAGCHRCTVVIQRSNTASRRFVEKLGFRREGTHRLGYDTETDAVSYGLLRDEYRWGYNDV